jgi:hypothetical protein
MKGPTTQCLSGETTVFHCRHVPKFLPSVVEDSASDASHFALVLFVFSPVQFQLQGLKAPAQEEFSLPVYAESITIEKRIIPVPFLLPERSSISTFYDQSKQYKNGFQIFAIVF